MKSENSKENVVLSKKLTVKNSLGLHARPAALFVETSNKFESEIFVKKGDLRVNGKSIMGLMMLAAGCGSKLVVDAEGKDAREALAQIEKLFENKFFEE